MDYQEIKNWLEEKENKQKIVLGICFILVFIVGFGTGRLSPASRIAQTSKQPNYTIKTSPKPTPPSKNGGGDSAVVAGTSTPATCVIKGNINSKGGKIYHIPGGASYKITKPEQCFNTEAEARAAGFTKSSR